MAPIISLPSALNSLVSRHLFDYHQTTRDDKSHPTQTLPQAVSNVISARQVATTTVIADSGTSGGTTLSGGAIAGIVIGTIAGTLLLLWLIRSCLNLGYPGLWGSTFEPEHEKPSVAAYDYPSRHHHHHHHRHRSHSEHSPRRASFVSTTTRPVVVEPRGRSPRAPQPAYYPRKGEVVDSRDLRRLSDGRRHRGY